MYLILIIVLLIIMFINYYLGKCFHNFKFIKDINNKYLSWFTAYLPSLIFIIFMLFGYFISIIIEFHLCIFFFICNMISNIFKNKYDINRKKYVSGISAIVITILYLAYGYYNATNIVCTKYTVNGNEKLSEEYKIIQISDLHLGSTFNGNDMNKYIDDINKINPDVLVITGDLIDESTTLSDMKIGIENIGKSNAKYGIYFIFGNHDSNAYGGNKFFTTKELIQELNNNNISILNDEYKLINDDFYLIGRKDKTDKSRKSLHDLLNGIDKNKYTVLLDHQPVEYEIANENNIDLLLSGHTHGGQIFPAGMFGTLLSSNEMTYGIKTIKSTTYIVSSGMSGWNFPLRTQGIAEYVLIDIKK